MDDEASHLFTSFGKWIGFELKCSAPKKYAKWHAEYQNSILTYIYIDCCFKNAEFNAEYLSGSKRPGERHYGDREIGGTLRRQRKKQHCQKSTVKSVPTCKINPWQFPRNSSIFTLMSYLAFSVFSCGQKATCRLACRTNQWWRTLPPCPPRKWISSGFTRQSCGRKLAGLVDGLPLVQSVHAAEPIQFTYVYMAICKKNTPWKFVWLAGTPGIWSKKFTTTPLPGNGDVFGVRMMTNDHWQKSSESWRSDDGFAGDRSMSRNPIPSIKPREVQYIFFKVNNRQISSSRIIRLNWNSYGFFVLRLPDKTLPPLKFDHLLKTLLRVFLVDRKLHFLRLEEYKGSCQYNASFVDATRSSKWLATLLKSLLSLLKMLVRNNTVGFCLESSVMAKLHVCLCDWKRAGALPQADDWW